MPGAPAGFGCYASPMAYKDLCPAFEAAMELVARRWTPLIVQQLDGAPRRYSELAAAIPALSERVLSERLKGLEAAGVVRREVVPDTPPRVLYGLTPKGKALASALGPLGAWAE